MCRSFIVIAVEVIVAVAVIVAVKVAVTVVMASQWHWQSQCQWLVFNSCQRQDFFVSCQTPPPPLPESTKLHKIGTRQFCRNYQWWKFNEEETANLTSVWTRICDDLKIYTCDSTCYWTTFTLFLTFSKYDYLPGCGPSLISSWDSIFFYLFDLGVTRA